MSASDADVMIVDLEDFTPPSRRNEARSGLVDLLGRWRKEDRVTAVRINALDEDEPLDLAAAMPGQPDIIAYPMAASADQMRALHAAVSQGGTSTEYGVTDPAGNGAGVVDVRNCRRKPRIRAALLGAEAAGCERARPRWCGARSRAPPIRARMPGSADQRRRRFSDAEAPATKRARPAARLPLQVLAASGACATDQ
jgi:citrate lyase beta subunit